MLQELELVDGPPETSVYAISIDTQMRPGFKGALRFDVTAWNAGAPEPLEGQEGEEVVAGA
jgi:hypothetical protein